MARKALPAVTLCAAASVNVEATLAALSACVEQIDFGECLLFTDAEVEPSQPEVRVVRISRLASAEAYSKFLLERLVDYVGTSHCLIVQWDGFVLNADGWAPEFLSYDYIGAPWPQFPDGQDVGNGGFSLRSRKLLEACRDPSFCSGHPEDVVVCRVNRRLLEQEHGVRFADRATAERFAFERTVPAEQTFGFHGIFNMVPVLGPERFWQIYRMLDDRSTATVDYGLLMRQLGSGRDTLACRTRLTFDLIADLFKRWSGTRGAQAA